jgi:Na+/proline symporter
MFMLLMILYTYRGGIKTIVWTDTLQTTFMLATVILSIFLIMEGTGFSFTEWIDKIHHSDYSAMFHTEWRGRTHWLKQFLSGAFIAIVMTGLDQDMMQKNLSCRNLREAKKNIYWMSVSLIPVNLLILILGASLYLFAEANGIPIPAKTDNLFPIIAIQHLPPVAGIIFLIGLISAAYSSADSALTSLTTSISVDFLNLNERTDWDEKKKTRIRYLTHFMVGMLIVGIIVVFATINDESVINELFTLAGYTYGPLLGMFFFGMFTKREVKDSLVPFIALASPAITYILNSYSEWLFNGYKFGFELLILNGAITFAGLLLIKKTKIKSI